MKNLMIERYEGSKGLLFAIPEEPETFHFSIYS